MKCIERVRHIERFTTLCFQKIYQRKSQNQKLSLIYVNHDDFKRNVTKHNKMFKSMRENTALKLSVG